MTRLLFVYNADTGFFNLAADIAHKLFSPSTYPCRLCAITHGIFSIRKEWESFVAEAPVPFDFLHRDEFRAQYPALSNMPLPAVFRCSGERVEVMLDAAALAGLPTVASLRDVLSTQLAELAFP